MRHKSRIVLYAVSALVLTGADQAWKNKQFPEWTEDDAKEVMKDSPWAKSVVATVVRSSAGGTTAVPVQLPTLTVRWESALPMREAKRKTRNIAAPTLDDNYYAIAVYGIPRNSVVDAAKALADELRKQAVVKREGKRDTRPSTVEILLREDGPVVVYLFPKSAAFNWRDHRIEFSAQVANLKFSQTFSTDDMTFHGKLEL